MKWVCPKCKKEFIGDKITDNENKCIKGNCPICKDLIILKPVWK